VKIDVEGIDRNDGSVLGKECVIKGYNELSSEENLYGGVAEASLGRVGSSDDLLAVSNVAYSHRTLLFVGGLGTRGIDDSLKQRHERREIDRMFVFLVLVVHT
jgi:hypothetical protein